VITRAARRGPTVAARQRNNRLWTARKRAVPVEAGHYMSVLLAEGPGPVREHLIPFLLQYSRVTLLQVS